MSDRANFYVLVGSSGAAPIGMQFVVVTLIASWDERPTTDALKAFAWDTVTQIVVPHQGT